MKLIEPGSHVDLPNGIKGRVCRVGIDPSQCVTYLVAWWDDGNRKIEWLQDFEVELADDSLQMDVHPQKPVPESRIADTINTMANNNPLLEQIDKALKNRELQIERLKQEINELRAKSGQ